MIYEVTGRYAKEYFYEIIVGRKVKAENVINWDYSPRGRTHDQFVLFQTLDGRRWYVHKHDFVSTATTNAESAYLLKKEGY